MRYIESEFFDLYKKVDAICRDMFIGQHYYNEKGDEVFGVSVYIQIMEQMTVRQHYVFPAWKKDYYTLKHLRWIRNQIAHIETVSECNEDDLAQLNNFYVQLLNQTDPLAIVFKAARQEEEARKEFSLASKHQAAIDDTDTQTDRPHRSLLRIFGIGFIVVVVAFVCLVIYYAIK